MKDLLLRQVLTLGLALIAWPAVARAQANNLCDQPGERPDVIVGEIVGEQRYGTVGDITAFAFGTTSCNIGTCWLNWIASTPDHPVIAQNLFRLRNGRFEQIGQSWIKHGFGAANGNLCSNSCIPADGQHLGVNCSDPYTAGDNGMQPVLGPKSEVNATTGVHTHPYTAQGQSGDAIYKRLQVHNADLDPALNPGARYFVEAQYITADDAAASNSRNNVSYREALASGAAGVFALTLTGDTQMQQPGILAWGAHETGVVVVDVGPYVMAYKVSPAGAGMWHYEYAVENLLSHTSARAFRLPIPHGARIENVGFHDVDYHSGEVIDGTDWSVTIDTLSSPATLTWATEAYEVDPDANALRWGTLYNFRFDSDRPPAATKATILPFRPGGQTLFWAIAGPARCGDAFCDVDESDAICPLDCADLGVAGVVPDGAAAPGTPLLVAREPNGDLHLTWDFSCLAADADYEVYEGTLGQFASHRAVQCSTSGKRSVTLAPGAGSTYYLIVPNNGFREGSYGTASDGTPRPQGQAACMSQSVAGCD